MDKLQLQKRNILGKKVRHIRREGNTPSVIYNSQGKSINTSMSNSDANWLYRNTTSTTILDTQLGKDTFKTLVKDFCINPVTEEINHVSLFQIDEKAEMVFTIPFDIVGISPAVKNNLGVLVNVLDSIDVKCKLSELQPSITIDVSNLEHPGQTINVDDIALPKGMELINDEQANATIVTITEVQKMEEIVVPEEEEVEGETTTEEGTAVEGEELPKEPTPVTTE